MGQPEMLAGLDHRRNLLKEVGVAVNGIAALVAGGPGERLPGLLWVLFALVVCAARADCAGRHRCGRVRTGPQVGRG
jgi:hypothetical protein